MSVRTRRLSRPIAVAIAAVMAVPMLGVAQATVAVAGPAAGLCAGDSTRGSVPADFPLDACVNASGFWIRNNLSIPILLSTQGDVGGPSPVSINQSVEAVVTRIRYSDPLELMPSDLVHIPAGAGPASVSIKSADAAGFYALAFTAATFFPTGAAVQAYQAFAGLLSEIADVYGQYKDCLVGKNWIGKLGCDALLARNVTYAFGRAVVNGLAKGALSLFLSAATFVKWADSQVPDVSSVVHGTQTISLAGAQPAATTTAAPGATTTVQPTVTGGPLTVSFSQNPFLCDGSSHAMGTLSGAQPGERIVFSSPTVGGLLPGTANGSGQLGLKWQCNPNEAGQSWTVTATGQSSARTVTFTVTGAAPSQPPQPQPTLTFSFSQNPFLCDGSSHAMGTLSGAQPGERIVFSSPTVGGLLPGTANGSGQLGLIWQCNPNEAGQSWTVTATGQSSARTGTFTVTGAAPSQPAPPPPNSSTWDEIAWGPPGGTVPLFSGGPGVNANGAAGPAARIPVGSHITVDCRSYNQAIASSNSGGWWYHIAAGQYAGYWTPASVYENGTGAYPATGGLWDPAVRTC